MSLLSLVIEIVNDARLLQNKAHGVFLAMDSNVEKTEGSEPTPLKGGEHQKRIKQFVARHVKVVFGFLCVCIIAPIIAALVIAHINNDSKPGIREYKNATKSISFRNMQNVQEECEIFLSPSYSNNVIYLTNGDDVLYISLPGGVGKIDDRIIPRYTFDGPSSAVTAELIHQGNGNMSCGLRVKGDSWWADLYLTTVGAEGKNQPTYQIYATSMYNNKLKGKENHTLYSATNVFVRIAKDESVLTESYSVTGEPDDWKTIYALTNVFGKAQIELFSLQENANLVNTNAPDIVGFSKLFIQVNPGRVDPVIRHPFE